jgi:hypothetical protein
VSIPKFSGVCVARTFLFSVVCYTSFLVDVCNVCDLFYYITDGSCTYKNSKVHRSEKSFWSPIYIFFKNTFFLYVNTAALGWTGESRPSCKSGQEIGRIGFQT